MNVLGDGTGWVLPPRCAARYTLGVLWRYGIEILNYHDLNPEIDVKQIVMNVRNPYTRLRSWLRLWNTTLSPTVSSAAYIENLHTLSFAQVNFVTKIENPNSLDVPWKYPMALSRYTAILSEHGKKVDFLVRQEHYKDDMILAGYNTHGYKYTDSEFKPLPLSEQDFVKEVRIGFSAKEKDGKWEQGDGQSDLEFYRDNPFCAEIVRTYYAADFEQFGYSFDPEKMMD